MSVGPVPRVWTASTMGTVASIRVITAGPTPAAVEPAVRACIAQLDADDRLFSPYRAESAVSRIRDGRMPLVDAGPRVGEVARACADARTATGGLFDAWRDGWFDPTGYVKGWAVEQATRRWLAPLVGGRGVIAVGLNVGGDMQLLTADDADWEWRVGIADPRLRGDVLTVLGIRGGAVATSGPAERGAHITDPRTGRPAVGLAGVTVVADDLTEADVWATAGVVAGPGDTAWAGRPSLRTVITVGADGTRRVWARGTPVTVGAAGPFTSARAAG